MDAIEARGFIGQNEANPARWRGHLDKLLPTKRPKLARGHFAAMPYRDVPAFIASLRERPATAARALEFCILTAAQSGEALATRWDEFDLDEKVWTVPPERTKAGREHRVPLSDRAVAILEEKGGPDGAGRTGDYVFSGRRTARPTPRTASAHHSAIGPATRRISNSSCSRGAPKNRPRHSFGRPQRNGAICLSEQAYWQVKGRLDLAVSSGVRETPIKMIKASARIFRCAVETEARERST